MSEEILSYLPSLMEKRPDIKIEFLKKITDIIPTKDEIKEILQEIKNLREDTNKRFEEVNKRFEEINKRFEELVKEMNKRFELMDKRISRLEVDVGTLKRDVGTLKGLVKEEWYRGRAYAVFGSVLYKGKNYIEIADKLLIKAVEEGKITKDERKKVLSTDMLWYGERKEKWGVLVVEISWTIGGVGVMRAKERAEILRRIGVPAIPAVAGVEIAKGVNLEGVVCFIDGWCNEEEFEKLFQEIGKNKEKEE